MRKIIVIIPYFGKFPEHFLFFLKSIEFNPKVQFLIVTDNDLTNLPLNVTLKKMTFNDFVDKINSMFDFEISLKAPYKLVDYKPAYGYIFENDIKGYEMWGYADIDQIFGDILNLLPKNYTKYDKIFSLGHLTLFKNTFENNRLFMNAPKGTMDYSNVFQSEFIGVFDEINGIEKIFQLSGKRVYNDNVFADISWKTKRFVRVYSRLNKISVPEYHNMNYDAYLWKNGQLLGLSVDETGNIVSEELMYLHFQKRKLSGDSKLLDTNTPFLITYKGFEACSRNQLISQVQHSNKTTIFMEFIAYIKYSYYIWKRRVLKYALGK